MPRLVAVTLILLGAAGCGSSTEKIEPVVVDETLGGETSVEDTSRDAFSQPAGNLVGDRRDAFFVGNAIFNRNWVTAPSSTSGMDGLGPTFNATSCSACHFKDGRGAPPLNDREPFLGILVRLSIPGVDAHGGPKPEPNYGGQLNPLAVLGVPAEGEALVTYTEVKGSFDDGSSYTLARPEYRFERLGFGPLSKDVLFSPRVAPHMVGLGLLEALDEATIRGHVDEDDGDGDGISGRTNTVWDPKAQRMRLGRFGWKANQAGLEQQTSGAFLGDMGITSPLLSDESCPDAQVECQAQRTGGRPEIDKKKLDAVVYYSHLLAVPAQRDGADATVRAGQALFDDAGCAGCHLTTLRTGKLEGYPELSHQTIHPYTDLLLHDMGKELSDGRPDFEATGDEWRTPPLWGIGLFETVNDHTRYLHDGRARNLEEAVLWHGGEAKAARDAYLGMNSKERAALVRFLASL